MSKNDLESVNLIGDDERGFDFIRVEDVKQLEALKLDHNGVLTAYLEITPEALASGRTRVELKNLIKAKSATIENKKERRLFESAGAEMLDYLQSGVLPGRGMTLIYVPEEKVWRAYRLPVPFETKIAWEERPYLRPMLLLMDEFEPYGVILADREKARFFLSYLGEVAEYDIKVQGEALPKRAGSGWSEANYQRKVEELAKKHFKQVVEVARRLAELDQWERIVLGGTDENIRRMEALLPKALQAMVAGHFNASLDANFNVVRDRVLEIEQEREREVEAERVEALITRAHKGDRAVLGITPVLDATQQYRLYMLIVPADFHTPGWHCIQCPGLVSEVDRPEATTCPYCGAPLDHDDDIIDLLMQRAVDQQAILEVVRGEERERLLREGPIGALLRF